MRGTTVAGPPSAADPAPMASATAPLRTTAARRRRWAQLAGVAAAAALVVAAMIAVSLAGVRDGAVPGPGERPAAAADVGARFAGIPQHGAALGDPRAPVTLVEFADLQCPFCAEWDRQVLPAVLARVRSGEVRLVLRPLRFLGPDSATAAALAGAAARQNRMWGLVDLLYRNQGEENSGYLTAAFQRRIAPPAPGPPRPPRAAPPRGPRPRRHAPDGGPRHARRHAPHRDRRARGADGRGGLDTV